MSGYFNREDDFTDGYIQHITTQHYDLQTFKNVNDVLYRLDIKTSIYPGFLCKFVEMICYKHKIKATQKVYDTILGFMIKIANDLKNPNNNKKTNYLKEYKEMIMSFND